MKIVYKFNLLIIYVILKFSHCDSFDFSIHKYHRKHPQTFDITIDAIVNVPSAIRGNKNGYSKVIVLFPNNKVNAQSVHVMRQDLWDTNYLSDLSTFSPKLSPLTYSRPAHAVVPEILHGAKGYYDHSREYFNFKHIYGDYLEDAHHLQCHSGNSIIDNDIVGAFNYAEEKIREYKNINDQYLWMDPRGFNFSDFLYAATLKAKFNEFTTEFLTKDKCVSRKKIIFEISKIILPRNKFCNLNLPKDPKIICNPKEKFRRIDGKCNNLAKPNIGGNFHCHRRLLPPDYSDGILKPRASTNGSPLPSTRLITQFLLPDIRNIDKKLTQMTMQWGQFLVHDVVRTMQYFGLAIRCCDLVANGGPLHPECVPILNFPLDYATRNQSCINTIRSLSCNTCKLGPRDQLNIATPVLDLSHIYGGNTLNTAQTLRTFTKGQLRVSRDKFNNEILPVRRLPRDSDPIDLTPCNEPLARPDLTCFLTGDGIRANQNPTINAISVLILRRHNQHADALSKVNPHWGDEILFQEARRLLIAEVNAIHFGQYLQSILGKYLMKYFKLNLSHNGYTKFDPSVDPSSIQSVGVAAHRFGHSQIASVFRILNSIYQFSDRNDSYLLRDRFFRMSDIWMGNTEGIIKGLIEDPSLGTDPFIVTDVKDFLFFNPRTPTVIDLPAININRGREHGVPGYVNYLRYCTGADIDSWRSLYQFIPKPQVRRIRRIYKHWKDIDLFVGGLSETHLPNANLGPTFACLMGIQFYHWKYGDRFYFEHGGESGSFTLEQLNNIRKVSSLTNLICKTTSIESAQRNVFFYPSEKNPIIHCHTLLDFNYGLWRDAGYDYK